MKISSQIGQFFLLNCSYLMENSGNSPSGLGGLTIVLRDKPGYSRIDGKTLCFVLHMFDQPAMNSKAHKMMVLTFTGVIGWAWSDWGEFVAS